MRRGNSHRGGEGLVKKGGEGGPKGIGEGGGGEGEGGSTLLVDYCVYDRTLSYDCG